jgi:hypothetical protein
MRSEAANSESGTTLLAPPGAIKRTQGLSGISAPLAPSSAIPGLTMACRGWTRGHVVEKSSSFDESRVHP